MIKLGKWIGGGLGWALGGPIGGLLGFLIGGAIDRAKDSSSYASLGDEHDIPQTNRDNFAVSLIVLVAAVLKADGKVVKSELECVKRFFVSQFGLANASEATLMLRDILKKEIPVKEVCRQIAQYMDYSARLQLLHILFDISVADGELVEAEQNLIFSISDFLNISSTDYESLKNMFVRETDSAYKILEIDKSATNEEIKKAYRRMAVKYHPDKVAHLGEEYRKNAEEKFKKVNEAYETIKKERNII